MPLQELNYNSESYSGSELSIWASLGLTSRKLAINCSALSLSTVAAHLSATPSRVAFGNWDFKMPSVKLLAFTKAALIYPRT